MLCLFLTVVEVVAFFSGCRVMVGVAVSSNRLEQASVAFVKWVLVYDWCG